MTGAPALRDRRGRGGGGGPLKELFTDSLHIRAIMWRAFYQALSNFWTPTDELRAMIALPFRERIKLLGRWSYWRASFRWPVTWRRLVVVFVAIQSRNVGYLAARGFQTVALEHQAAAMARRSGATARKTGKKIEVVGL